MWRMSLTYDERLSLYEHNAGLWRDKNREEGSLTYMDKRIRDESGKSRNKRKREKGRKKKCMPVCVVAYHALSRFPLSRARYWNECPIHARRGGGFCRDVGWDEKRDKRGRTRGRREEGENQLRGSRERERERVAVSERCRSLWSSPTVILRVTLPRERTNGNAPSRPAHVHTQLRRTRTHICHRPENRTRRVELHAPSFIVLDCSHRYSSR